MLKKRLTNLVCLTAICVLGFGAFNEARADDPCLNFNIQLLEVVRDHGDVFQYKYTATDEGLPISKISLLEFGIDGALTATETNNIKVFLPGEGGLGTDNWLEGVPQLQVLNITAQSYTEANPLVIYVSGTGGNVGTVASHSQAGNKIETCFIEGPVVGLPVDVSIPSSKTVSLDGVDYCIDLNPRTGCPDPNPVVYNCETNELLPLDLDFVLGSSAASGDAEGPTTPTMIHGEGSDPRCPVSKAAHNPCQWVLIGGSAYGPICW